MPEPHSTGAAGGFLAAKMLGALGAGTLGALIIAAVDPPKTRRELFLQALAAGVGSMVFGPGVIKVLDHYSTFVDLTKASGIEFFEWAVPVYFVIGALSWGAFGALARLRQIIRERAAERIARQFGAGK